MASNANGADKSEEDLYITLLKKWKLEKYITKFKENDWDDVGLWGNLKDEIMVSDLRFSLGAIHKFNVNYNNWCNQQNEVSKTRQSEDDGPKYYDLTLTGSWIDNRQRYGSPARWSKDRDGLVRLHGVIELAEGQSDELVGVLPQKAHPTHPIYVNRVDSRGVTVNIVIYGDESSDGKSGDIKLQSASNSKEKYVGSSDAYVSLNGINWYNVSE